MKKFIFIAIVCLSLFGCNKQYPSMVGKILHDDSGNTYKIDNYFWKFNWRFYKQYIDPINKDIIWVEVGKD
jgi:hypothetical protein